jgi:hypothetical protein
MPEKHGARQFLDTVFWLLLVTAAAKVVSALEGIRLLARFDPLLPLSVRETLLLAAALELSCAAVVRVVRLTGISCLLVACLGAQFILYHVAVHMTGMPGPCPCLGSLAAWTGMSDRTARVIVLAIAIYLLLGGTYYYWASKGHPSGRDGTVHSDPLGECDGKRRDRTSFRPIGATGAPVQGNARGSEAG